MHQFGVKGTKHSALGKKAETRNIIFENCCKYNKEMSLAM